MTIKIRIPAPLRQLSNGAGEVHVTSATVAECVSALDSQYPGFKERLCDETGEMRRFVNLYLNGEDVRFLDGLATTVKSGDEVSIVPAVAGGSL